MYANTEIKYMLRLKNYLLNKKTEKCSQILDIETLNLTKDKLCS